MKISRLFQKLRKRIYRKTEVVIYAYDKGKQGAGMLDSGVCIYDKNNPPPSDVKNEICFLEGRLSYWLMKRRLDRYGGKLLCIRKKERIESYGWIQNWKPFRRRYGWLAEEAVLLGPFWTRPDCRGQGLYGRLLGHSIAVCEQRDRIPLLIITSPDNKSSQRGIEKAGFAKVGIFCCTHFCFSLFVSHQVVEQHCRLDELLSHPS